MRKFQLLDSLDEKVAKHLLLSNYSTADEIFHVSEYRYRNQAVIALEISEELEAAPPARGNQPRRIVELIQTVQKECVTMYNLSELGSADTIKNPLVTKSIVGTKGLAHICCC